MKKDYKLYVISRIVKGRRDYLVEDLNTFTNKFSKARFFDSKKEATTWLRSIVTYNLLSPTLHESQPVYELLSVTMKISKETCPV